MKDFSFFFILLLISSTLAAQSSSSLPQQYDSLPPAKLTHYDSASLRINNKIDSLQLRANQLLNPDLSLNHLRQRLTKREIKPSDSLNAVRDLDSIKGGLQHKIDSLSSLRLPTEKYQHKLDSIGQLSPEKYLAEVQSKKNNMQGKVDQSISSVENRINKPIDNVESKVNEKLALMNQEGGPGANLPGSASVGNIKLPTDDLDVIKADVELNTGDLKVPGVENLDIDNPLNRIENPLTDQMGQLNDVKEKVGDIKEIPQQQIDRLKSIDEVEVIQGKAGQANALVDKAQSYQNDVSKIAKGDVGELDAIPEAIEQRVAKLEEVKDLQAQTGEMTKYQDMLSKGNDPKALAGMAKTEAIKYATDHFAGQQVALKAAMEKMSKLKSKYSQVPNLKDLPKRAPNAMKGKPFIERFIPGLTFQIQKTNSLLLDLSPVASYRFTGRFSAGAGWNERISFEKWNKVIAQDRIYGPRLFSSFSFRKGFSLKAEVEKMNVYVPTFTGTTEGYRTWVWSVFVGFKKDYTFFKSVKGNVQVLYNIYDDHDNSPYLDRLNVRMGWEFPMKKAHRNPTRL